MALMLTGYCKFTPELVDRVEESLKINASWSAAARYAHVTDRTLLNYRQRAQRYEERITSGLSQDNDPDQPYWEAVERWTEARAHGEVELVSKARQLALNGDVRMIMFLLRVGWPADYSERLEVTGPEGGPLEVNVEERASQLVERVRAHQERCTKHDAVGPRAD